jgi:hypothetical protein
LLPRTLGLFVTRKSVREYLAAQQARFHHVRAVVHHRSLQDSSCASVGRDGCVAASRRAWARRCRCFRRFGRVGEAVAQHWRDEMSHSSSIVPKCKMRIRLRRKSETGREHDREPDQPSAARDASASTRGRDARPGAGDAGRARPGATSSSGPSAAS